MNAKTGLAFKDGYSECMGRYGNGEQLVEFALEDRLCLVNTKFRHTMSHRTTCTAPERSSNHKDKDGKIRRNPYRNQIDYILVRTAHLEFVNNARSYGGISTNTDHKLVLADLTLKWYKMRQNSNNSQAKFNLNKFKDPNVKTQYKNKVEELIENANKSEDPREELKMIADNCIKAAEQ